MARVKIPVDHPCFAGHFPGHPILPGVLLLERVMSLVRSRLGQPLTSCTVYNVKFLAPVAPGNELDVSLSDGVASEYRFAVRIAVATGEEGVLACNGQLRVTSAES